MATIKDKAIDNLWITTDDYKSYSISPPPASKLIQDKSNSLGSKDSKVEGTIVYFIPKDSKGKVIGKPTRLLFQNKGGSNYRYILANVVEPYYENILNNKSKWQSLGAYDLIALAEQKASGLGEAIASKFSGVRGGDYDLNGTVNNPDLIRLLPNKNIIKYGVSGIKKPITQGSGNSDSVSLGADSSIDLLDANKLDTDVSGIYGYGGENLMKLIDPFAVQYGINSIAYGANGFDTIISDRYVNTNVGGYRNNSFDIVYGANGDNPDVINLANSAMPHGNPEAEFNLVLGADASKVDIHSNYLATPNNSFNVVFGVDGVNDATKQIYTPEEMQMLYKKSGSKKTFADWVSSGNAKGLVDSLNQLATLIGQIKGGTLGTGTSSGDTTTTKDNTVDNTPPPATETKILGMSPITFGLVALGSIAVASVVTIYLIRKARAGKVSK